MVNAAFHKFGDLSSPSPSPSSVPWRVSWENKNLTKSSISPTKLQEDRHPAPEAEVTEQWGTCSRIDIRPLAPSPNPLQISQLSESDSNLGNGRSIFSSQAWIYRTSFNAEKNHCKAITLETWLLIPFLYECYMTIYPLTFLLAGIDDFTCLQPQWPRLKDCVCLEIKLGFSSIILPPCGPMSPDLCVLSKRHKEAQSLGALESPLNVMAEWELHPLTQQIFIEHLVWTMNHSMCWECVINR